MSKTTKYLIILFLIVSLKCYSFPLGSGASDERINFVGNPYLDAIELLVFEWNGRLAGDYTVRDGEPDFRFVNERIVIRNQAFIRHLTEEHGTDLERISFIVEFNRVHIFAIDEDFEVIGHVVNNSDEFYIPDSGPMFEPDDADNPVNSPENPKNPTED